MVSQRPIVQVQCETQHTAHRLVLVNSQQTAKQAVAVEVEVAEALQTAYPLWLL
jgi:hypothetical protein